MAELDTLRSKIDELDARLVELLAKRFEVSRRIGELKRTSELAPRDAEREERQLRRIRELAIREGLSPDLAESILRLIVDRVVTEHQDA